MIRGGPMGFDCGSSRASGLRCPWLVGCAGFQGIPVVFRSGTFRLDLSLMPTLAGLTLSAQSFPVGNKKKDSVPVGLCSLWTGALCHKPPMRMCHNRWVEPTTVG